MDLHQFDLGVLLDLQRREGGCRYGDAATLRDKLAAAQAQLAGSTFGNDADNVQRRFVLGQRVLHKIHGYRGVVCGYVDAPSDTGGVFCHVLPSVTFGDVQKPLVSAS